MLDVKRLKTEALENALEIVKKGQKESYNYSYWLRKIKKDDFYDRANSYLKKKCRQMKQARKVIEKELKRRETIQKSLEAVINALYDILKDNKGETEND